MNDQVLKGKLGTINTFLFFYNIRHQALEANFSEFVLTTLSQNFRDQNLVLIFKNSVIKNKIRTCKTEFSLNRKNVKFCNQVKHSFEKEKHFFRTFKRQELRVGHSYSLLAQWDCQQFVLQQYRTTFLVVFQYCSIAVFSEPVLHVNK